MAKRFRFWDFTNRMHYESDSLEQISATGIKNGLACEKRLYLALTQPKGPKNVYLLIGIVFHGVIEFVMRAKVRNEYKWTYGWNDCEAEFERLWAKESAGVVFPAKMPEAAAKRKCSNYICLYLNNRAKILMPASANSIEIFTTFTARSGAKKIIITCKADLIVKGGIVVDHKTSSSEWGQEKAEAEPQAQLYPVAFKAQGIDIKGFEFDVAWGATVTPYPVAFSMEKALWYIGKCFEWQSNFDNGIILENRGRACSTCDYKEACNG